MYLVPEKELYTIIQLFYSGNHEQIVHLDLETEFDFTNPLYKMEAVLYRARSLLLLKKTEESKSTLEQGLSELREELSKELIDEKSFEYIENELTALLNYIDSNPIDVKVNDTLGSLFKYLSGEETLAQVKVGDNLELATFYSILLNDAQTINNLKAAFSDALILDFASAWLGLTIDDDEEISVKTSYYFFDELCSSSNTSNDKTWISLLLCHLKMGHFQEATECLANIKSENECALIAKIALASIQGQESARLELTSKLQKEYPNNAYVKDLNEKNDLFSEVVASY